MGFYARPRLVTEIYDASWPELGDVPFYLEQARRTGGPVLELGCGTGRVVWPLAAAGFEVVGLDLSEVMLGYARAKTADHPGEAAARARFVHGDMARFELPERFGLVFSAFRAFQALLTPEEQRACLACAHRHLRPGGLLVLDLFDPRLELCVDGDVPPAGEVGAYVHPVSGRTVRVQTLTRRNDALRQVLIERWLFTELDADGRAVRREEETLELRWTYRFEMRHLLELCGFEVEAEYSDFQASPPRHGREQVWVAKRP